MESRKILTIMLFLFATTVIIVIRQVSSADDESARMNGDSTNFSMSDDHSTEAVRRRVSRILAQKIPENYTCNVFPRVCRLKGSSGRDCCKKKCVNVKSDPNNCGMCGLKCRYNEICCKKKCLNSRFDRKNCGRCGIKCKKGDVCAYGMCSYA